MADLNKQEAKSDAGKPRPTLDWLDPEIEVPPDEGAVIGIVNGVINGIEHQNAVSLVCYDRGEWWMFDRPDIDVKVDWWMPLPEPPEVK